MEVRMTGGGNQGHMDGETDSHVISVASKCSSSQEQRLKEQPTLLKPTASNVSCCIFKVPRSLAQINEKAYEPRIVSIGPYHHGKERLNMVEQHKPRFFSAVLERTKNGGVGLNDYLNAIASMENKIRDCYSEELPCASSDLVEMMILDACFIVEVFHISAHVIQPDPDHPFSTTQWILTFLLRDLLQIENQIPFFVLQVVFDLSKGNTAEEAAMGSLSELALRFFNIVAQKPREQLEKFYGLSNVRHLLDLLRLSFIGHAEMEQPRIVDVDYLQLIPSATQLLRSGIKFRPGKGYNSNLLDIRFNKGVFQMSPLTLDDFMSSFFLNCIAFEQCYCYCSQHITSYIIFIICLVSTEMDAEFLSDEHILVNYFGSNAEVATFFNALRQDITFDIRTSYLADLFEQVNRYHQVQLNGRLPRIKRYFAASWPSIVAVASFVVSVSTFFSAFYTIYAYYSS